MLAKCEGTCVVYKANMTAVETKCCLVEVPIQPVCESVVVIPARNEEDWLTRCLSSLATQQRVPLETFEIILLLNNCTDRSLARAISFATQHPHLAIHIVERHLPEEHANIGTVRKMLMDEACRRLIETRKAEGAILTTDADTFVDREWIVRNLEELSRGVDVVGGRIALPGKEIRCLESKIRRSYFWDVVYGMLLSKLEAELDPVPWDPWPRHHQSFCGSLALTSQIYRKIGGLPAVTNLEDIALCHAVLKAGGRIRHSNEVKVWTSARLCGRVLVGLSSHLQNFQQQETCRVEHALLSANRFAMSGTLRRLGVPFDKRQEALRVLQRSWGGLSDMPITEAIAALWQMTT